MQIRSQHALDQHGEHGTVGRIEAIDQPARQAQAARHRDAAQHDGGHGEDAHIKRMAEECVARASAGPPSHK